MLRIYCRFLRRRSLRPGLFAVALAALFVYCGSHAAAQTPTPGRIFSTTYVDNYGGLFWINPDGSNFVSVTPYSYQGARGPDGTPSASANGKVLAFESGRGFASGERHVWVMNGDGTGAHQLTSSGVALPGVPFTDKYPVVSPDGTKIAFISNRNVVTFPPDFPFNGIQVAFNDVYVINVDGTNFHQVTQTQPNFGSGVFGSDVGSVVWGPDSKRLAFRGLRLVNGGYHAGIFFINADGTGESNFAILDSTGQHAALDWSPDGRYITTPYGAEAQGAGPYRLIVYDLQIPNNTKTLLFGATNVETSAAGTVRFSPDSKQIVYLQTNDYQTDYAVISNLDGSNAHAVPNLVLGRFNWLWWQQGAAVATPVKLTLSYNIPPDLLLLKVGQPPVTVTPTLYDAKGKVIVHAVGDWEPSDSRFFTIGYNGLATALMTQSFGPLSLTATNGGISSAPLKVMVDRPALQIKLDTIFNYAGSTQPRFYLANSGAGGAINVRITSVTLDGVAPTGDIYGGQLPSGYFNVAPGGASGDLIYLFPISSKPSGTIVLLKVKGTYDWYGTIDATVRVKLP